MSLKLRVDAVERVMGSLDTSPAIMTVRSLGNRKFTFNGFMSYCKDSMPGHCHPIRALIVSAISAFEGPEYAGLDGPAPFWKDFRFPESLPDTMPDRLPYAVKAVDDAIVAGAFEWLPEAIAEWERANPELASGQWDPRFRWESRYKSQ